MGNCRCFDDLPEHKNVLGKKCWYTDGGFMYKEDLSTNKNMSWTFHFNSCIFCNLEPTNRFYTLYKSSDPFPNKIVLNCLGVPILKVYRKDGKWGYGKKSETQDR